MKKFSKILITLMVIAGVAFLALPADAVFAQDEEPPLNDTETEPTPPDLEEWFASLVKRYEKAEEKVVRAGKAVERLEERIADREAEGKETAGLDVVLEAVTEKTAGMESAYADLGDMIEEHAGFDDDGAVVDESLALTTVRQIADALLDLNQMGEDARYELRWDLMTYFFQHRPEN